MEIVDHKQRWLHQRLKVIHQLADDCFPGEARCRLDALDLAHRAGERADHRQPEPLPISAPPLDLHPRHPIEQCLGP